MAIALKRFKARIYKTGINWAVDVPIAITKKMIPVRGYINVEGTINGFKFSKNLVPVKNGPYRLFVHGIMMKGAQTAIGDVAEFALRQVAPNTYKDYPIPPLLQKKLMQHKLIDAFEELKPGRRKEILRYMSFIKTTATMIKNVNKLIARLKNPNNPVTIP